MTEGTGPALIAELRDHIVRKTGSPIDARMEFLTSTLEVLLAAEPQIPVGLEYDLTPKQSAVVTHLARRPGFIFTREAIMDAVYFDRYDQPDPKLLDVMMFKIREKLVSHDAPYWVEAVWGFGFRFVHTPARKGRKYVKGMKRA